MTGQQSVHFCNCTFQEKYKGCIFSATEMCESYTFAIHFQKVLYRIFEGTKDPKEWLFQLFFFFESFYVFTSSFLHFCCFQTLENTRGGAALCACLWRCGCLCNKHNSCWSPWWKSLAWAQGSWWCFPSGLLAAGSSLEHMDEGQDGTAPPVPKAWDWCKEINTAECHTAVTSWMESILGIAVRCCGFFLLSALPIFLPFLSYPFSPEMAKSKFYLWFLRPVWFFVGSHLNNISISLTSKICSM